MALIIQKVFGVYLLGARPLGVVRDQLLDFYRAPVFSMHLVDARLSCHQLCSYPPLTLPPVILGNVNSLHVTMSQMIWRVCLLWLEQIRNDFRSHKEMIF